MNKLVLALLCWLMVASSGPRARADDSAGASKGRKPASAADGRSTIEFDEKVVEGMGAKDLSAAHHTGENRTRKGEGLVREKTDFHDEMKRSLREVPWVQ